MKSKTNFRQMLSSITLLTVIVPTSLSAVACGTNIITKNKINLNDAITNTSVDNDTNQTNIIQKLLDKNTKYNIQTSDLKIKNFKETDYNIPGTAVIEAITDSNFIGSVTITIETKKDYVGRIVHNINNSEYVFDILVTKTVAELKNSMFKFIKNSLPDDLKEHFKETLFSVNEITEKDGIIPLNDNNFQVVKNYPEHNLFLYYNYENLTRQKARIHVLTQPINLSKVEVGNYFIRAHSYSLSNDIKNTILYDKKFHELINNVANETNINIIKSVYEYSYSDIYTDKNLTIKYSRNDIKSGAILYLKLASFENRWHGFEPRIINYTTIPIYII